MNGIFDVGLIILFAVLSVNLWCVGVSAYTEAEILAKYPDCNLDNLGDIELLGDGICHTTEWYDYNTEACGWDAGDCIIEEYPDCHLGYPAEYIGDGGCDKALDSEECGWDGGDCVVEGYPDCDVAPPV